jgi:hypothetical protein
MSTLNDYADRFLYVLKFLNNNKHIVNASISRLHQWSGTEDNKRNDGSKNVKESLYLVMLRVCDLYYKYIYKMCAKTLVCCSFYKRYNRHIARTRPAKVFYFIHHLIF